MRRVADSPTMRPVVRLGVATVVALPAAFLLAFVLAPDPTGVMPLVLGALGTGVLGAVVYVRLE
jgi:uncharacterized membrane protein YccC